jgi:hypothetical protein
MAVLLTAAAWVGWRWGPAVFPRVEQWVAANAATSAEAEAGPVPSPMLAEATLDRFEAFRTGQTTEDRLRLGSVELSSVVRYALPGIVPAGVSEPTVDLDEGRVVLSARVATSAFPDLPALGEVIGVLPDTVGVVIRGGLEPYQPNFAALAVERVEAARIPLPSRMIPPILDALGRTPRDGLSPETMALPLPTGLARVFVEGDRLVLVADR